jgi:hypothetical protein
MRWLLSALIMAVWTFVDVLLNEAALRQALAAALGVVVVVTAVLWLYGLHVVFFMGYIPIEQPLMYFTVNAGLAFIKYSECALPPAPAPG